MKVHSVKTTTAGVQARPIVAQGPMESTTLDAAMRARLPKNPFFIPKAEVDALKRDFHLTTDQLLHALMPVAQERAFPCVSHVHVSAVGIGESGNLYMGANIEIAHSDPHENVHAEGFMTVNAMKHGETRIVEAECKTPCGHCRQLLNETRRGQEMALTFDDKPHTVGQILPEAYGQNGQLMMPQHVPLGDLIDARPSDNKTLNAAALQAAREAYVPKYPMAAGVAMKLADGSIHTGSFMDVPGHNASLSPHLAALIDIMSDGKPFDSIRQVVLVEEKDSPYTHKDVTRSVLRSIAPHATLTIRHADRIAK